MRSRKYFLKRKILKNVKCQNKHSDVQMCVFHLSLVSKLMSNFSRPNPHNLCSLVGSVWLGRKIEAIENGEGEETKRIKEI